MRQTQILSVRHGALWALRAVYGAHGSCSAALALEDRVGGSSVDKHTWGAVRVASCKWARLTCTRSLARKEPPPLRTVQ